MPRTFYKAPIVKDIVKTVFCTGAVIFVSSSHGASRRIHAVAGNTSAVTCPCVASWCNLQGARHSDEKEWHGIKGAEWCCLQLFPSRHRHGVTKCIDCVSTCQGTSQSLQHSMHRAPVLQQARADSVQAGLENATGSQVLQSSEKSIDVPKGSSFDSTSRLRQGGAMDLHESGCDGHDPQTPLHCPFFPRPKTMTPKKGQRIQAGSAAIHPSWA